MPKAYPELAYIYSTPARTGGNNVGGNSGNVFGMGRRAAYNQIPQQDASMPSTAYMGSGNTIGYTGGRYDDQGQPMI